MSLWLAGRGALIVGGGPAADAVAGLFATAGATAVRAYADAAFARGCTGEALAAFVDSHQVLSAAPFSILVLAGLPAERKSSEGIDVASWRDSMAQDLDMRFLVGAEFGRRRIALGRPGAVLHLLARDEAAGNSALASAAAGTENMVKTLATEWARDGIRSNAIASRIVREGTIEELQALGRLALYLCSDYAAYVTGCIMGVNEV